MTNYITLPDYPGYRFDVVPDQDACNPVSDSGCPVEVYAFRGGYSSTASDNSGRISRIFDRFHDYYDTDKALAATRRYLVIFEGWGEDTAEQNVTTYTHQGYSPSDWLDLLVAVDDPSPAYGLAQGWAEEWSQWARGDVFSVAIEQLVPCDTPDKCHLDEEDHYSNMSDQGVRLSDVCGIYADDEEEAAKYLASIEL